jgi:hypothetical protein
MKVPRQCPLVLLVMWVLEEVRRSVMKTVRVKKVRQGQKLSRVPLHSVRTPK